MPAERLQKVLARAGVASRRGAEALIEARRVTVDGRVATIGESADPASQRIELDGVPLGESQAAVHYAVHKPRGYLSSARAERGHRSVVELVGPHDGSRLWPAGRLDLDSEGLMILTNDGAWANRVLHPRYGLEREYAVLLDAMPSDAELRTLLDGVELDDGSARLLAVERRAPPPEMAPPSLPGGAWLRTRVGEGRKREVRRLFAAVGRRVERLVRTRLGPLTVDGLAEGAWRPLRSEEVEALAGRLPRVATPAARRTPLTVAIDGPSGSGKSTIGHALAQRIGATFVDTGLMYRALTLAALERGLDPDDEAGLARLARAVRIEVRKPRRDQAPRRETVLLDRRDVTDQARTPRIDRAVSRVSRHAAVRAAMLTVQRAAARRRDTVMVGRDIGTVVLPGATLKVFLTASAAVRAARRAAEMGRPERGDRYLAEILERDAADTQRPVAPLRKASGALVLDTGELDVAACVSGIVAELPGTR